MPELALSIKRLPTGYILSPLKFSLLLLYLFCEQSGSFPEVKAAEPSQTRAYGSHCLVTGENQFSKRAQVTTSGSTKEKVGETLEYET